MSGSSNLPKGISVVGNQMRSEMRDNIVKGHATPFPYLMWKGSSIVTNLLSLIGLVNTVPPWRKESKIFKVCIYIYLNIQFSCEWNDIVFNVMGPFADNRLMLLQVMNKGFYS